MKDRISIDIRNIGLNFSTPKYSEHKQNVLTFMMVGFHTLNETFT